MSKKIVVLLTFVVVLIPASLFAAPAPLNLSAKSAILLVASTGEVLYEKNAQAQQYPASTTKMMTIITALEDGNLNDMVTTSAHAANTEGSSMYLRPEERLRLQDMLYGVALVSGNDAAVAVAEHLDGSVERFAKRMTAKAHAIGAMRTNFRNPSGLPDPNDHAHAAPGRLFGKLMHFSRCPVGRGHDHFVLNRKFLQHFHCRGHDIPIRITSHNYGNLHNRPSFNIFSDKKTSGELRVTKSAKPPRPGFCPLGVARKRLRHLVTATPTFTRSNLNGTGNVGRAEP